MQFNRNRIVSRRRVSLVAIALSLATIPAAGLSAKSTLGQSWSAKASVERRLVMGSGVIFSPNGSKFYFRTYQGNLECDCNIFTLYVFDTESVRTALSEGRDVEPILRMSRRAYTRYATQFDQAEWTKDGKEIRFWGNAENSRPAPGSNEELDEFGEVQFYSLSVPDGDLKTLIDWPGPITNPRVYDGIAFARLFRFPDRGSKKPVYPFHYYDDDDILSVMQGKFSSVVDFVPYISIDNSVPFEVSFSFWGQSPELARHGQNLIVHAVNTFENPPSDWVGYDALSYDPYRDRLAFTKEIDNWGRPPAFYFVNGEGRSSRRLFNAPTGLATSVGSALAANLPPKALWAKDGRHVILVNTALPLDEKRPERRHMAYLAAYDTTTGHWSELEPLQAGTGQGLRRVKRVGWQDDGTSLIVEHEARGKAASATIYRLENGAWVAREAPPGSQPSAPRSIAPALTEKKPASIPADFKILLEQSANMPPNLVAVSGSRRLPLLPPDQALAGVNMNRVQPFEFSLPGGQKVTAGLVLPRTKSKTPPPLVIAGIASNYDPTQFQPDGGTDSNAAQLLAERGMAVLLLPLRNRVAKSEKDVAKEVDAFVEDRDAAVEALAQKGLADPDRVGLIGFSRNGMAVYFAITHPGKIKYKAAIVDDSFPLSYSYYLFTTALDAVEDLENKGGKKLNEGYFRGTFWNDKAKWLKYETSFNVDKVKTPALFAFQNQGEAYAATDTIGAFRANRRPLEFLMYPEGRHGQIKPLGRMANIMNNADWMSFWLMGYEDPDPAKKRQYARWRLLRADWQRQQAWEALGHPAGSLPDANFQAPPYPSGKH